MNDRRKLLLVLLVPLIALLLIGGVGTVELGIWLALFAAWLTAYLTWAKPSRTE